MSKLNLTIPPGIEEPGFDYLTRQEIELRVRFVGEYFKDLSYRKALTRVGYKGVVLEDMCKLFLGDPCVQQLISKGSPIPESEDGLTDQQAIHNKVLKGLIQCANDFGPDSTNSARVAAWNSVAKLSGMEQGIPSTNKPVEVPEFDFSNCDSEELRLHAKLAEYQLSKRAKNISNG